MERRKEISSLWLVILAALFAISIIWAVPKTAGAESGSRDGLEVTVETDKEEYAVGDEIQVVVKVANNSTEPLNNITVDLDIPKGVKLAEGTSTKITIASLAQGEVNATEMKAEAVEAGSANVTANSSTTVKTGDSHVPVVVWVIMAAALMAGILLLVKPEHRKKAAKLFGILAFAVGVALFSGMVYAYTVVFEIHKTIKIGGIEKTIHLVISYEIGGKGETSTEDIDKDNSTESTEDVDENASTEDTEEMGVKWKFEDGTLTIYGRGKMEDCFDLNGVPWYDYCEAINNVVIENGVTSIGDYAFCKFHNLTSVEIPDSITSIGYDAFLECGFTNIKIPSSVTSIGYRAFGGCDSLTSIEIPSSVTSIGDWAFACCRSLTSIEIPSSVTSIGDGAFLDCKSLTSIEIPSSVTSIGDWFVFFGCDSLTIYGTSGSYAETYANKHGYTFIAK